jgi:TetR/AcrR family transcriptional regulator
MPRSSPKTSSAAPAPRQPRGPGRPPKEGSDQRTAVLDAARLVFARDGFAGTSLRAIAQTAHVSAALPAYYFVDKKGLLTAVLEECVAPLVQSLHVTVQAAAPEPVAMLEAFIHAYTRTAARNPWLPQLIVREVLSEQGVLRDVFAQRFAKGMTAMLSDLIRRGQSSGALRKDLDPAHVVMSLIALSVFPFIARPLVSGALGIQVDESRADALARHHLSLLLGGIREEA